MANWQLQLIMQICNRRKSVNPNFLILKSLISVATMSSAAVSAALDAELRALSTVSLQLNQCSELLRRRSVPRVTVLLDSLTRNSTTPRSHSPTCTEFTTVKKSKKNFFFFFFFFFFSKSLCSFAFQHCRRLFCPPRCATSPFRRKCNFPRWVPPEAARLIVAMATATARLGSDLVAALVVPLQSTASMRALLWSLCVVVKPDAPPAHIVHTVADALLAQLARAGTADLQRVDDLPRWSADLLASALTHAPLAPLAESAAAALLDDAYAGRRPLLDVVLLFRRVVPLVRGAVPRLRALLADRAALLHLFALERVSPTPTAVESVVDVLASSSDALVPLADDLVRAAASSLADDTLRPIALAVLRGACLQLAGIDFVAPTRTPLLAALKPSLLPLLVQLIGAGGDDALLDSLVAVVAGSRDSEAATALTCAAAQRDAQLFVLLLNRWYRAFPDLVRSVLAAGLVQNEYAPQLALLARIAVANPSPIGAAVRASVRTQCSVLVEQLARADEHEASALACFALLRSAFSIVDDGERLRCVWRRERARPSASPACVARRAVPIAARRAHVARRRTGQTVCRRRCTARRRAKQRCNDCRRR
jgi:hypothetical protein